MVPKINSLRRSFAGVAAYCMHDAPTPDDRSPETSERVGWTDTRNLATVRAEERAVPLMAATAKAAPDLKRLAGGARGGRKLAKPVLHYSLSWGRDETPDGREMSCAVDGSGPRRRVAVLATAYRQPRLGALAFLDKPDPARESVHVAADDPALTIFARSQATQASMSIALRRRVVSA